MSKEMREFISTLLIGFVILVSIIGGLYVTGYVANYFAPTEEFLIIYGIIIWVRIVVVSFIFIVISYTIGSLFKSSVTK